MPPGPPDPQDRLATATAHLATTVLRLFRVRRVALYQREAGSDSLVCIAAATDRDPHDWLGQRLPMGSGVAGRSYDAGTPLWIPDVLAEPALHLPAWALQRIETDGFRSVASVPVVVEGATIGALSVSDVLGRRFTERDLEMLTAFAEQAATAIEKERLYAASENRRRSLVTLAEVAAGVARGIAVPALLDTIAEAAAALFGGEAAFRLADGKFLVRAGATPGAREAMPRERLRIGESLSGWVALTGEPASTEDIVSDRRVIDEHRASARSDRLGGMLCVPLRTGGRTLGTLNIYRERGYRFDEHAVTLATLLANHAAVALENAELFSREQTARAEAEATADALRAREEQYRALVDGSIQGMYIHQDGLIRFVNASLLRIFGYERPEELIDVDYRVLIAPDDHARVEAYRTARLRGAVTPTRYEARGVKKGGAEIWIETLVSIVPWEGKPAFLGTFLDITDRRAAEEALRQNEEQLRQAQKMEAIGQLAGGIAHDFNNLLTVITGRSQLLLRRVGADDRARRDAQLILLTAERAAALTKRLLAFSRKQAFHPSIVDLSQLVEQLGPMLQRLLPEDIEFALRGDPELWMVRADPTQIEQVLLNLVVNAADAMPCGGRLSIETSNVERAVRRRQSDGSAPSGPRVRLSVTDTGAGMSEEVRTHLFEPFFTTKPPGKGTGLGLSTVYGIVQQHGGSISVASVLGRGTTFTIDLLRADTKSDATDRRAPAESPARGSETILLVEDEQEVRHLAREILEEDGYVVIEAGDPTDALRLGQQTQHPIDLLLTDVVMPGMSGPELATRLTAARANLPVLFMSAYAPDAIRQRGMPGNGVVVEKPFRPNALSRAVRTVLDGWASIGPPRRSHVPG